MSQSNRGPFSLDPEPLIWIHPMKPVPKPTAKQMMHFICPPSNPEHCPVLPGDSRVVTMHVPPVK